ncbi:MAG: hypothetical protein Q4A55_07275 [Aerococcus sp.]|nr:hypothetical protein [Aerococcus sp.]
MSKRLFNFLLGAVILINIAIWSVYLNSQSFTAHAQAETLVKAEQESGVMWVDHFYILNKKSTSYTIVGPDKNKEEVFFSYDPETKKTKTTKAKGMVTEKNALSITQHDLPKAKVGEARLGVDNDQFVWEVSFTDEKGHLGYHYLKATNGEWYETINNL